MDPLYFGIDVAKNKLDLATTAKHLGVIENTAKGHRQLIQKVNLLAVKAGRDPHVALEASGGYERSSLEVLLDAGVTASLVQPGRVRHFAKAEQIHVKNDAADAKGIARFAERMRPRVAQKTDPSEKKLRALHDRREQVVADRVRESNRLETQQDREIAKLIRASICNLRKQEARLDEAIATLIKEHEPLEAKAQVLMEVKGVGVATAAVLLGHMPELGRVNRREAAALAGLAPYDRDSGKRHRPRSIFAGRAKVRKLLYMCAVSCSQHNPVLKELYQRLLANGKKPMVALIAVARKLLTYLNTRMARFLENEVVLGNPSRRG